MSAHKKLELLKEHLKNLGSVVVAFSGGVDSTFLLKVAGDVLQDKVLAVTATSEVTPQWELDQALELAKIIGVKHMVVRSGEMNIKEFIKGGKDRCYYCKKDRFAKILEIAQQLGMDYVADGSNLDDMQDYRPGIKAIKELKVKSPLKEVGMTKADIRILSKEIGLPTWDKPTFACLASRIPYDNEITREKLKMVEEAENCLLELGFRQFRVRHHGEIARIEVDPDERNKFFCEETMDHVSKRLKQIGFVFVALELEGYRTGSMNQVLKKRGEI